MIENIYKIDNRSVKDKRFNLESQLSSLGECSVKKAPKIIQISPKLEPH
jgi:hypothetical protein